MMAVEITLSYWGYGGSSACLEKVQLLLENVSDAPVQKDMDEDSLSKEGL